MTKDADRTVSQSDPRTDAHDALEAAYAAEFRDYAEQSGQVTCRRYHDLLSIREGKPCRACGAAR